MGALKLNPQRLADAIVRLEKCFDVDAKQALEERAALVMSLPDSAYKEELIRCEKVNEQNYNSILPSIRNLRESVNDVKELAEALAKRDIETTKAREAQATVEVTDSVSALRPF